MEVKFAIAQSILVYIWLFKSKSLGYAILERGKQTAKEASQHPSPFVSVAGYVNGRPGPERKLWLEWELLWTLSKLRVALSTVYLQFRFQGSANTVGSGLIMWVKLMSKKLSVSIVWPC